VTDGHAVEVHLTYAGKAFPPWPIAAEFASHCGGVTSIPNPSLATDAKGGVTGAIVWIDDIREGAALVPSDAEVDQKGCVFTPHVLAIPAGTRIHLHNGDQANHAVRLDVFFDPDANEIMRMVPPGGTDFIISNPAWAGRVAVITCPIHPWMLGWVRFFDHPYYAVTTDGVARIEHLPPGKWHLSVWHEALDARVSSTTETIRERPWTQARFDVTVGDHDVVKTLVLAADGTLTSR
jgi:plastocyanin